MLANDHAILRTAEKQFVKGKLTFSLTDSNTRAMSALFDRINNNHSLVVLYT